MSNVNELEATATDVERVIETKNLTKVYEGALKSQDVLALKDLTIHVNRGEIFSYLGPNGSGKTTTIKMILGLLFPTEGTITIMGRSNLSTPWIRRHIGYLPEGAYYPDFLRGEEVLDFYGRLYGLGGRDLKNRINAVLDTVGLVRARRRLVRGYSKGMRQRLGLAQALLSDPQILILDEPTTGLDPVARKDIRDLLMQLRKQGKTLFISSHELLEVELISDRVAILYEGRLQTIGTIQELLKERDVTLQVLEPPDEALERLAAVGIHAEDRIAQRVTLQVPPELTVYDAIVKCKEEKLSLLSVAPRRETLEDLFVRTVGAAGSNKE